MRTCGGLAKTKGCVVEREKGKAWMMTKFVSLRGGGEQNEGSTKWKEGTSKTGRR